MSTTIRQKCASCHTRKDALEFRPGAKCCRKCCQRYRRVYQLQDLWIVECRVGDRYHVAIKGHCLSLCRKSGVRPLKFGNGPSSLLTFKDDETTCPKCRKKVAEVCG